MQRNPVVRAPIFTQKEEVYAYELSPTKEGPSAHSKLLFHEIQNQGVHTLTGGREAFVPLDPEFVKNELLDELKKTDFAVKMSSSFLPQKELFYACRALKEKGVSFVFPSIVLDTKYKRFLELADIIQLDLSLGEEALCRELSQGRAKVLLKGVDDYATFQRLQESCSYFQGNFFKNLVPVPESQISHSKIASLDLMHEINQPELSLEALTQAIEKDAILVYKLLSLINSAYFGFTTSIDSIKHALALMGDVEVRNWSNLTLLQDIGQDKTEELITSALFRAKFCELSAPVFQLDTKKHDLFLMGLLSLTDVLFGRPMQEVLGRIPLEENIRHALLGYESEYRNVLFASLAAEEGRSQSSFLPSGSSEESEELAGYYLESLQTADQLLRVSSM